MTGPLDLLWKCLLGLCIRSTDFHTTLHFKAQNESKVACTVVAYMDKYVSVLSNTTKMEQKTQLRQRHVQEISKLCPLPRCFLLSLKNRGLFLIEIKWVMLFILLHMSPHGFHLAVYLRGHLMVDVSEKQVGVGF